MSVIMALRVKGDPQNLESFAGQNQARMEEILEQAKQNGLIAHRFYGSDSGDEIMVVDEWPDPESFQRFFEGSRDQIQPLFAEAGISEEPQPTFWRKLDTHDEYGWDS
jgi:heme-degrading monooxygenase HmoA